MNAQMVEAPPPGAYGCGAHGTSGDQTGPGCAAPENGRVDRVGQGQADGAGHHGASDRWDMPGEEDEYEGAAHHVEERDGADAPSLEDGHPPGGDTHANAHDQVEHEELDADLAR